MGTLGSLHLRSSCLLDDRIYRSDMGVGKMNYKLGKTSRTIKRGTLQIENYLDFPTLEQNYPLPAKVDYLTKPGQFSIAGNSDYGDCVVAGAAHMIQVCTATAGKMQTIPDKTVINTYFNLTGGPDCGLNLMDFLKFWKDTGFPGHKIGAYAAVNPKNVKAVKYANYLFGGLYIGLELPRTAQIQDIWQMTEHGMLVDGANRGSWGGHCVNGGYCDDSFIKVVTWGAVKAMTWDFLFNYCDEIYAIIMLEWFTAAHKTPHGIAWKDLLVDLGKVSRLP